MVVGLEIKLTRAAGSVFRTLAVERTGRGGDDRRGHEESGAQAEADGGWHHYEKCLDNRTVVKKRCLDEGDVLVRPRNGDEPIRVLLLMPC